MNRLTRSLILTAWVAFCAGVSADQVYVSKPSKVTTIELFTSEGCSSCPPAERWLARLKEDPGLWTDIIPMAFHVDYWNHLGWKDQFASAEFSNRQREYRAQGASASVYTPGIMVNGREFRGFFNPVTRNRAVPGERGEPGILVLKSSDGHAELELRPEAEQPLVAHLVYLGMNIEVPIKRGENAGRTLTHNFVVLQHLVTEGSGSWTFTSHRAPDAADAIVAWIAHPDSLKPLQAVGGPLQRQHP